ncbi:carbohydrate-binding module family 12 protein [Lepidopterella palustris CBS 459.81]|uniref:Carbohydrate-binding module family 12 protein n=1 Tax=Lepidopterella palustris CBS 459.81 TaxID=1314670 RepID=A0A8E2ED37_9PEZI|nr:carbohydrate-binding module family 12 protein [Lepidopterella palustris CBS 459.81]
MTEWKTQVLDSNSVVAPKSDIALIHSPYDPLVLQLPIVDIFYISPDGAVHHRTFNHTRNTWRHQQIAEPGSACPEGGITAVERNPLSHKPDSVFWVAPDGSIQSCSRPTSGSSWDDPWDRSRVTFAESDKAMPGSRLQAREVSSNQMMLYYVRNDDQNLAMAIHNELGGAYPDYWSCYERAAGPISKRSFAILEIQGVATIVFWISLGGILNITPGQLPADDFLMSNFSRQIAPASIGPSTGFPAAEAQTFPVNYDVQGEKELEAKFYWIAFDGSIQSERVDWIDLWKGSHTYQAEAEPLNIKSTSESSIALMNHNIYWVSPDGSLKCADAQVLPPNSVSTDSPLAVISGIPAPESKQILFRAPDGSLRSCYTVPSSRTWSATVSDYPGTTSIGYSITLNPDGSFHFSGTCIEPKEGALYFALTIALIPYREIQLGPIIFYMDGPIPAKGESIWNITSSAKRIVASHMDEYICAEFQAELRTMDHDPSTGQPGGPSDPSIGQRGDYVRDYVLGWTEGQFEPSGGRTPTVSLVVPMIGLDVYDVLFPVSAGEQPGRGNEMMLRNGYMFLPGPDNSIYVLSAPIGSQSPTETRQLTAEEYSWAQSEVFGDTLPPIEQLILTNAEIPWDVNEILPFTSLRYDGKILLNMGSKFTKDGVLSQSAPGDLIHVLMHAWQVKNNSQPLETLADQFLVDGRAGQSQWGQYSDVTSPPQQFSSWDLEQQARIVWHWYAGIRIAKEEGGFYGNQTGIPKDPNSPYYYYIVNNIRRGVINEADWHVGKAYHETDRVVFHGLTYAVREMHSAQVGWEPPGNYALWTLIPPSNEWSPQVMYKTGDQVIYGGHRYKALQGHQALAGWDPPDVPALWQQLD